MKSITPNQLNELRQQGQPFHLVDVRTPIEFRTAHAVDARNEPLQSIDPVAVAESLNGSKHEPIYVICQSGGRSSKAYQAFLDAGLDQVVNVEGGMNAWESTGLPVVREKGAVSLERQVRIAAGLLVLLGAVFGYLVHPYFYGVSAFVGAGLLFAGITDTCGMAMLLTRMPWNQARDSNRSCCKGSD